MTQEQRTRSAPRFRPGRVLARVLTVGWTVAVVVALAVIGLTWFAGWRLLSVESDSMSPTVPRFALAVTSPVAPRRIEVGDVIRFRDPGDRRTTVLHRVEQVLVTADGGRSFATRGDANRSVDPAFVSDTAVLGRMRFSTPHLGRVVTAVATPAAAYVLGGLPLLLLGVREVVLRRRRSRASQREAVLETAGV